MPNSVLESFRVIANKDHTAGPLLYELVGKTGEKGKAATLFFVKALVFLANKSIQSFNQCLSEIFGHVDNALDRLCNDLFAT